MPQVRDVPEAREATGADPLAQYIAGIGERVRGTRARRGMTRTDLSRDSGISLRYLAQVENGQANATDVETHDYLRR